MENLRRLLFAIFVFALAGLLFSWWRHGREGYGALDLLHGDKPTAAALTPAKGPKIALDELPLMSRLNDEFAKLSAAVLPSVVSITTKTVQPMQLSWHPFYGLIGEREQIVPGLGSGVIVSKEGHVVTNYHVIEGAVVSDIQVTTNDNKKYPALILGFNKERDIALLKIESTRLDFPALSFANSDDAKVGQIVLAVGNPFGLSGTVTQGIISARDRHLSDSQMDYLQTDTVINPGNSGGPLVNIRGEIIGINVAIYRGDATVRAWQGVGLAIPANEAKVVVDSIQAKLKEDAKKMATNLTGRGYLGLEVSSEPVEIDPVWGTSRRGALVTDIGRNSPAEEAGLHPGDVVTKFQGMAFRSPGDLLQIIRTQPPGSEVKLEVIRNNKMGDIIARLGERPDSSP
ncbi:trypsin-like peptidase domain-containing protein [Prosthecobacter sp.]|uniref:S1C family serine protease n=1 Tax=Prosthecobacter sp. TaxID=1965333 RepID=UPI001D804C9E|nr:trypsin-like peptidase domain-containing protein [Prosthecobacter sp.]MCB1277571.1 trypsin-like peptidase domain-containing protein [Prosthecobacter sp.]